jgi:dihydrofolate reductase
MTLEGVILNWENDGDGFKYSGRFLPYADKATGAAMPERLAKPVDLLLGRKTFEDWENYWPTHSNFWPNVMTATKYVASNTRDSSDWQPSVFLSGDLAEKVRELRQSDGPDLHVMGSADMLGRAGQLGRHRILGRISRLADQVLERFVFQSCAGA